MSWFRVARASRRLQRPLFSSSLSLSRSILNPLPASSHPTPNPNPDYHNPFRQYYRCTPISDLSRDNLKLDWWGYKSVAHISTSVSESSNSEEDKDGGSGLPKVEVSWIDLYLPKQARPYARLARLDKPIGTWLLAWPCMWYGFSFWCVCVSLCFVWLLGKSRKVFRFGCWENMGNAEENSILKPKWKLFVSA